MTRIAGVRGLVSAGLLLACGGGRADEPRGSPPAPPPEALQACQGAQDGATCSFTVGDRRLAGTCRTGPEGQAPACLPPHRHGPPPEAFQACASLAEGAACAIDFHGQSMAGTCRVPPRGDGPLACAPARPPDR